MLGPGQVGARPVLCEGPGPAVLAACAWMRIAMLCPALLETPTLAEAECREVYSRPGRGFISFPAAYFTLYSVSLLACLCVSP